MKNLLLGLLVAGLLMVLFSTQSNAGLLPDETVTPGVARTDIDTNKVCSTKWGKDVRLVTEKMKKQVFANYGMTGNDDAKCIHDSHGRKCEIDHLVSRELAGADDVRNLWAQSYGGSCNAAQKDRLENELHRLVCDKKSISIIDAQVALTSNWIDSYKKYVDPKGCM